MFGLSERCCGGFSCVAEHAAAVSLYNVERGGSPLCKRLLISSAGWMWFIWNCFYGKKLLIRFTRETSEVEIPVLTILRFTQHTSLRFLHNRCRLLSTNINEFWTSCASSSRVNVSSSAILGMIWTPSEFLPSKCRALSKASAKASAVPSVGNRRRQLFWLFAIFRSFNDSVSRQSAYGHELLRGFFHGRHVSLNVQSRVETKLPFVVSNHWSPWNLSPCSTRHLRKLPISLPKTSLWISQ